MGIEHIASNLLAWLCETHSLYFSKTTPRNSLCPRLQKISLEHWLLCKSYANALHVIPRNKCVTDHPPAYTIHCFYSSIIPLFFFLMNNLFCIDIKNYYTCFIYILLYFLISIQLYDTTGTGPQGTRPLKTYK